MSMESVVANIEAAGLAWQVGTSPNTGWRYAFVAANYHDLSIGDMNKMGTKVAEGKLYTLGALLHSAWYDYNKLIAGKSDLTAAQS